MTDVLNAEIGSPAEVELYQGAMGWRNLDNGKVIVVYPMLFTFRVCIGWQLDEGYERAWCYPPEKIDIVLSALNEWDGEGDPPVGWVKEVGGGRRRLDGDPDREYVDK